jgi:hypothetical protein
MVQFEEDEVHNPCKRDETHLISWTSGPVEPPPTASETITECKGCSMLCDITVCDYWSLCFRERYWHYDSGNTRPCVQMINIFLTQDLARFPQVNGNKWFQGNEATLQTARNLISASRHLFSNHVLLRNGDSSWPARSRDLSPCDSWVYLKGKLSCWNEDENSRRNRWRPSAYFASPDGKYAPKERERVTFKT